MPDPMLPPPRHALLVRVALSGGAGGARRRHPQEAALAHGASRSSAYRWWVRYRAAGWASLRDRPCTPHRQPRRLSREAEAEIIAVRERSGGGPEVVGAIVDRPASTVGKVLRRLGCSRLPKPPRAPVLPENVVRPNVTRRDTRTRDAARPGSVDPRLGPRSGAVTVAAGRPEPTVRAPGWQRCSYRSSSGLGARQAAVELAGDVALERADDLAFGAALRGAPGDVGTGARVEDHAHHDDAPERVVRATVAPAVESFAEGQPRRSVDRGDATEVGEGRFAMQAVGRQNLIGAALS